MSSQVEELLEKINAIDQSNLGSDDNARSKLILAAQALTTRLETPWDFVQRMTWQEVGRPSFSNMSALQIFAHGHVSIRAS